MPRKPLLTALFTTAAFLLAGCPELIVGTNVSGEYTGSWSTTAEEGAEVETCPMAFELVHYPNANSIEDATLVTGYVTLDFSCFTILHSILRFQNIAVGEIPVEGYSLAGGTFLLRSRDLIGGCNGDLCISLILSGTAIDSDGDGRADTLSGDWTALFPFPASGSFSAELDAEPA
ncbi:MAG: hypothetical protein KF886_09885 [Candidatus Hydrogenedentes bacterium]|nr:hypothetical protein [Candidatus Hydrogenedentota bacterium]